MKVYTLMPSAKPDRARRAAEAWTAQGYHMAIYQDPGTEPFVRGALTVIAPYEGVWKACNALAAVALQCDADVCVFAGDDMTPDPTLKADVIAKQYLERFPNGYGVMQPCGDTQGRDALGTPASARICGSAWFGKSWIREANMGMGPTWPHYYHFYADEELAITADVQGVMWWRPDLTQYHYHWSWNHMRKEAYHDKAQTHWKTDKALFIQRQLSGFPGARPLGTPVISRSDAQGDD